LATFFAFFFAHIHASADFNFYVFSCEWAGSVCETNNCNQDEGVSETFWNIHGLWPSDGTLNPSYCTNEKFDPDQLQSLDGKLTKYWNGLYSSADAFHSHEWTKHGTCSKMNQLEFFSTVLKLAQTLDIYSALSKHGITPGASYECNQISQVIKQEYGIEAFNITVDHGHLSSIEMCVDLDLNLRDCPKETTPTVCKGHVNYPHFNSKKTLIHE